jgi:pyruvate/2-oxoglutarate dehydrogenase complex dihydrolipoamide dehydrogenase (E3) component
MKRMRKLRARISKNDSVSRFSQNLGVDVYIGEAHFTGPNEIHVDGKELRFSKAVIATGVRRSQPALPVLVFGFCLYFY